MGDTIAKFVIGFEVLAFIVGLIIIVFLIFRRIKIKKKERFEDRDN
ncbi:MAG: hypothetical protein PF450_16800 [Bacteroidales bacterium]|jgi:uncharacterized membrane protein|nr:hypothetical protein [Bacteroidales bacterium]